ncbi:MAG: hypothetical protein ACOH19_17350 [Rhodoglobus sp.]
MLQLVTFLAAEPHEELAPLLMAPIGFAAIAAGVFIALGLVTFSFRDVANRHSHKVSKSDGHGAGH